MFRMCAVGQGHQQGGQLGKFALGPTLLGAPGAWGPCCIIKKRSKYSNRTVTLMQQSARYSVDNYSGKIFLTFNLRGSIPQKFPAIKKFLHIIIIKTACDYC